MKLKKYHLLLGALPMMVACQKAKQPDRPNIIFIMSDDHAEQAISCYGHGLNQTPNIDRLATEGVRFTNASVTNSICAPSRAVILTGKHSHANGLINNEVIFDGSQNTFPKLLKQAGYQTAIVGKWHLKSAPTGFDHWMVLPDQGEYYNPDFRTPEGIKRIPGYVTNIITDESLKWLDENQQKDQPFCLMVQHKAPHRNWMPAPEFVNHFDDADIPVPDNFFDDYSTRGKAAREQEMEIDAIMFPGYDLKMTQPGKDEIIRDGWGDWYDRMTPEQQQMWHNAYRAKNAAFHKANPKGKELALWKYKRYMQDYLSTIESVDKSVGQILDYLDEKGLAENTIVVYTSDQGFYLGEHGWFDKRFMYEESHSTPMLIRYPKGIKAGWVSDKLVQNLDIAQTFLEFAGVKAADDMQGLSMRPLLEQQSDQWRDAVYYHYYEYPGIHAVKRHYGIRTDRYKLIHFYFDVDEWELYDLQNDPKEMNNLYGQKGYEELTAQLKDKLTRLQQQYEVPGIADEMSRRYEQLSHNATSATIMLKQQPDKPYDTPAAALIDGQRKKFTPLWASDYSAFLGFNGTDLVATIDLGKPVAINKISARFLDKNGSWVYAPAAVTFSYSNNGRKFTNIKEVKAQKENVMNNVFVVNHDTDNINIKARYIKVSAQNFGNIPKGKPGAGMPSWLFCDEIIVK
ncbi:DUF4976 domain-containing protein [Marinilabiliaceae bacterium JC017]|nr:DUF4976 domain-containing protein [Marinilabiliaceae bacterium JC017]